jgi:alkaline phosphatase/alkaline phosphatase D
MKNMDRQFYFDSVGTTGITGRTHRQPQQGKGLIFFLSLIAVALLNACSKPEVPADVYLHYLMAGEPDTQSIILQARLAVADTLVYADIHNPQTLMDTDLAGSMGYARFLYSEDPALKNALHSPWFKASPERDHIIRFQADNLQPGLPYFYRLEFGADTLKVHRSAIQSFRTLPGIQGNQPVSFVMVTGSHLSRFYLGGGFGKASSQGKEAYQGEDKYLGFHAFEAIATLNPDFFVGNGDNVYYDHPDNYKVVELAGMRAMWHRQFSMPRVQKMLARVPAYWMKDDHDYRFDDADTTLAHPLHGADPSHKLGMEVFLEQVPVSPVTYRTYRVNKALQIWMVEGRDFRSPNDLPDSPEKSIWGTAQKAWLQRTLLESDATFKILITPTPMVGPDDARKKDNHANLEGFRHEGDSFFQWLQQNGFSPESFFILTGDRHWQYHAIHPTGFHELSCGAMVDQNARLGVAPGAPNSSDPEGNIQQLYTSKVPSGGFLYVGVSTNHNGQPHISFQFFDEYGEGLYTFAPTLP